MRSGKNGEREREREREREILSSKSISHGADRKTFAIFTLQTRLLVCIKIKEA